MKLKKLVLLLFLIFSLAGFSHAAVGQSAVITLAFPYGARATGMGEVGTALADGASVLYFNPAGLDLPNDEWQGGTCSFFYEPLLPAFHIPELWHSAFSANFQDTACMWGQLGAFRNYINMGVNTWTDEMGRTIGSSPSHETVYGLGWGFDFKELGIKNHYFGVTLKYYVSALAPGIGGSGTGVGCGAAVDAGYLWTIGHGFRFGATLMNMGSPVYYSDPENSDPIPFTINLALAFSRAYWVDDLKFISLAGEVRYDREVVKNYPDRKPDPFYRAIWTDLLHDTNETPKFELQQVNRHIGGEITFFNTFSVRMGYLTDPVGERYEFHHGIGIKLCNHFALDWASIYAPEGYMRSFARRYGSIQEGSSGARDGQWQVSFTMTRLFYWSEKDLCWWESGK